MEIPIALHGVAHRVSHQIPAESEMSRQNRATPPQIKVSHLSPDPPVALSYLIRSRQGAMGGVSWRAGGGYRSTLGFRKRIALQGGVAATVTPVALLFATKNTHPCTTIPGRQKFSKRHETPVILVFTTSDHIHHLCHTLSTHLFGRFSERPRHVS